MGRKSLYGEPTVTVGIKVPASKVEEYKKIADIVLEMYLVENFSAVKVVQKRLIDELVATWGSPLIPNPMWEEAISERYQEPAVKVIDYQIGMVDKKRLIEGDWKGIATKPKDRPEGCLCKIETTTSGISIVLKKCKNCKTAKR